MGNSTTGGNIFGGSRFRDTGLLEQPIPVKNPVGNFPSLVENPVDVTARRPGGDVISDIIAPPATRFEASLRRNPLQVDRRNQAGVVGDIREAGPAEPELPQMRMLPINNPVSRMPMERKFDVSTPLTKRPDMRQPRRPRAKSPKEFVTNQVQTGKLGMF